MAERTKRRLANKVDWRFGANARQMNNRWVEMENDVVYIFDTATSKEPRFVLMSDILIEFADNE